MVLDVKRAFLYGQARRPIYLKLPKEDPCSAGGKLVGRLERSLYGTRDAPQIWQEELKETMEAIGYRGCASHPGVYYHPASGAMAVAHVDDVLAIGPKSQLQNLQSQLQKKYELKHEILGPDPDEAKEVEFLGRSIKWTATGLEYQAGQKHIQTLVEDWNMQQCRAVGSPSTA